MTDQQILNRLKNLLGDLYDPAKEDMYLRVVRKAMEFKPTFKPPQLVHSMDQKPDIGTAVYLNARYGFRGW